MEPTEPYEIPGGCEDPRLVRIGDLFRIADVSNPGRNSAKSAENHTARSAVNTELDSETERR